MAKVLVTGGAGFIGANVVQRHLQMGDAVIIYDNLERKGAERNLAWLKQQGKFTLVQGDVRDYPALREVLETHRDLDTVYHLAAQVAVTTSVVNPRLDFEVNALGTFNVLEAIRETGNRAVLLYASTNKVYGGMEELAVVETPQGYRYRDLPTGVPETQPLDFHSPYGCSKGAADQYVRDYQRIYGLKTVGFRQSCIYGYRQYGVEDQGWVAWFTIAAVLGKPITIYGDGKQVRDILFIDDLVECYLTARQHLHVTSGQIYNVGGGPGNVLSLLQLLDFLSEELGHSIPHRFADWRPGDQRVFVADIAKARQHFGWEPAVSALDGVRRLLRWVQENQAELSQLF